VTGNSDGLAARLPKSEFLIKILERIDRPLISTSLNLSGRKDITPKHLANHFTDKKSLPDLVVDIGGRGRRRHSRLIDLREESKPLVLRK